VSGKSDLFELVKSLTASEKRYFRLFSRQHRATGDNDYMLLFDVLDDLDTLDAEAIKARLAKLKPGFQLAANQTYLHKMILKAMRSYTSESTPSGRMNEMIKDISFLEAKGHFSQAAKQLEKAIDLSRQKGFLNFHLELLRIRQRMLPILYPKDLRARMELTLEEKRQVLARLDMEQSVGNLFSLVLVMRREMGQPGSQVSKDLLLTTVQGGMEGLSADDLTLQGKAIWLMLQAIRSEVEGQLPKALEWALGVKEIWQMDPDLMLEMPQLYRVSLSNMLAWAFQCRRWDLFPETIEQINSLPPSNPRDEAELFQNSRLMQLVYLMNTGQLTEAHGLMPVIEKGLERHGALINLSRRLTLQYNVAIAAFFTGHHKDALRWISQILEERGSHTRGDILEFASTLQLMVHHELGNTDLLEYTLRSARRRLPASQSDTTPERVVITFIEKAMEAKPKELAKLAKAGLAELDKLDPAVAKRTGVSEIRLWLERKVQG
jgi:hypothetical protein